MISAEVIMMIAISNAVVAPLGGVVEEPAHPRPGEDHLGEERAGEEEGHVERHQRHQRDGGVAEGVAQDDQPLAQPLRPRRAHVVLVDHLQHRGAQEAGVPGDPARRQHRHRQDQVVRCGRPSEKGCAHRRARRRRAAAGRR